MLLVEWNATAADYPRDKCLHELFGEQAAKTPDAVALVYEDSTLTYGELGPALEPAGASSARARGRAGGRWSGCASSARSEMVVGLLGILKAGGAYLPLDPGYPAERLATCWRMRAGGGGDAGAAGRADCRSMMRGWCGSMPTGTRSQHSRQRRHRATRRCPTTSPM